MRKNVYKSELNIVSSPNFQISAAIVEATNDCTDSGQGPLCFTRPGSDFKEEWGECITGELTPEEEILSDRIVRAWTNYAIYGCVSYHAISIRF